MAELSTSDAQAGTSATMLDGNPPASSPTSPSRLPQLDVLRAVAVLLVIGNHAYSAPPAAAPWWHILQKLLHKAGWSGVDLFFVLSGYLISGLLFREHRKYGNVQIGRFLLRRGFKIYPPLYALVAITYAGLLWADLPNAYASDITELARRRIIAELLFLQSYWTRFWPQTWSLGVEEHFYLLMALAVGASARWRHKDRPFESFPLLCACLLPTVLGLRLLTSILNPKFSFHYHYYPTHLRLDALLFGVLLSYYHVYRKTQFEEFVLQHRFALTIFAVVALTAALLPDLQSYSTRIAGFTLLYLGYGALLAIAVASRPSSISIGPVYAVLAFIGKYSYSIYLWHWTVLLWLPILLGRLFQTTLSYVPAVLAYVLLSIVVGIAMGFLVEWPALRLRDRWLPGRSRAVANG